MIGRLYRQHVLPRLVDHACRIRPVERQRAKIVPRASGEVLEIGLGTGLNLPHYCPDRVGRLWALEPAEKMWELAEERLAKTKIPVERLLAEAEDVPLPDQSVDMVVVTYTLCTIPNAHGALTEASRVLRAGGRLLFCEHGASPEPSVHRWQRRVTPVWKRLAGGCQLDRPIFELIERAGFRILDRQTMYLPGWRPATYNMWGTATPAGPGPNESLAPGTT